MGCVRDEREPPLDRNDLARNQRADILPAFDRSQHRHLPKAEREPSRCGLSSATREKIADKSPRLRESESDSKSRVIDREPPIGAHDKRCPPVFRTARNVDRSPQRPRPLDSTRSRRTLPSLLPRPRAMPERHRGDRRSTPTVLARASPRIPGPAGGGSFSRITRPWARAAGRVPRARS